MYANFLTDYIYSFSRCFYAKRLTNEKHNKQFIIRDNDIYTMPDLTRLVASSTTNAKV